jgi:hypothetical protein
LGENRLGVKIFNGRYTADSSEEDFVVFIVGMRINQIFAITKWFPVAKAMGPMIKELYQNPEWGFKHTEILYSWRTITLIQYWKGFDELLSYAHGNTHSLAWKDYNIKINNNGSVGVFHETYKIEKGASESIYNNMPKIGLSKALSHIPVSKNKDSAIKRMSVK